MKRLKRKIAVGLLLLIVGLMVAAPYLAAVQPVRDGMLRLVLRDVHGRVHAGGASLGWFSPIDFRDLEISGNDGTPAVTLPSLRGDQPLWRYLLHPTDLGTFALDRPALNVVVTPRGLNLAEVFPVGKPAAPPVALEAHINDGQLVFTGLNSQSPWKIDKFSFTVAIDRAPVASGRPPEFVLQPCRLCDHTHVTPQMCEDGLKFIAPWLTKATSVSGTISVDLDEWRIPAGQPAAGHGSGRLQVHSVDVGPAPIVQLVAEMLGVSPEFCLAKDSVVAFELKDGRVYHHNLFLVLGTIAVRSEGSVGLADQSLDIVADVPLPSGLLANGPLAKLFGGKTIRVPIGGTLARPRIDFEGLRTANRGLLLDGALRGLLPQLIPSN